MKTLLIQAATSLTDDLPPIRLERFIEESGLSHVTCWRYRRKGWLRTLNIAGKVFLTRSAVREFNERAANGEFARVVKSPTRKAVSVAKAGK